MIGVGRFRVPDELAFRDTRPEPFRQERLSGESFPLYNSFACMGSNRMIVLSESENALCVLTESTDTVRPYRSHMCECVIRPHRCGNGTLLARDRDWIAGA